MLNKIKLNVKGKNIDRFIKRMYQNDIEIYKINYIKYDEINIVILYKNYQKLMDLKTVYEVSIIKYYGIINIRKKINYYKLLILFLFIGFILLILLSNMIFKIEIIDNDKYLRSLLLQELNKNGIAQYKFKKNYSDIQKIKQNILNNNKNIEWIEIEEHGTTYVVKFQKRIINNNKIDLNKFNIVAKKSAILKKIELEKGNVLKNINDYVYKNDIVIGGEIYLNDSLKDIVNAKGKIYGNVWYNVKVEYPLYYNKVNKTGNKKTGYYLKLLNKNIYLKNIYQFKEVEDKVLLSSNLLPIKLIKQTQYELSNQSYIYTKEEAKEETIKLIIKKFEDANSKVTNYKILNEEIKNNKLNISLFFTVYEDITSYQKIEGESNVP